MKLFKTYLFFLIPLIGLNFACESIQNKGDKQGYDGLKIKLSKTISLDISSGFPKLYGNPLFFSDENGSYFYIQTGEGIGTFDLQKGGEPIDYLRLVELVGLRGQTSTGQNHFIPFSKNDFLYFDRKNDEIFLIEDSQVTLSKKLARLIQEGPKPLSGSLKFAVKNNEIVSVLNMLEVFAKPPFEYQERTNSIGIFSADLQQFQSKLPLPEEYLGKKVNAYDLLISMDYNSKTDEYIINYPILDDLIITDDFENFRRMSASPKKEFVSLSSRSGEIIGEWKKEYYTNNTFFTTYYDPFRNLYIRHYREGLSESDYDLLALNSFKMFDPKNRNFLLFLDDQGNQIHTMDVSDFNHLYIHFGTEGMYILNDTKLENEDSLTFSLFSIESN